MNESIQTHKSSAATASYQQTSPEMSHPEAIAGDTEMDTPQTNTPQSDAGQQQHTSAATERAKQSARQYAGEKKLQLAEELEILSGAIRKASAKLHEEDHDSIANFSDAAAEQIDYVRASLQSKDVAQLLDDVQCYVRRRPEVVCAGLFVAGIAATRLFERDATSPRSVHDEPESRQELNDDSNRPPEAFGHSPRSEAVRPAGYRNETVPDTPRQEGS